MEVENYGGSFFDEIWNLWLIFNLFIIIFWEFVVFFVKGLVGVFVLRVLLMINFLCVGVLIVVFLDICCFLWVDERCSGVVVMVFGGIVYVWLGGIFEKVDVDLLILRKFDVDLGIVFCI